MKRVALLADVRDWAFDVNLHAMADYVPGYDYTFLYVAEYPQGWQSLDGFDVVFAPYHRWGLDLPWHKTLGSLRAEYMRPECPGPPDDSDFALVNRHRAFHVVHARHFELYRDRCPHLCYLTNPVDTARFCQPTEVNGGVVATWNGNAAHENPVLGLVKGFHDIVVPACAAAGVQLEAAEYNRSRLPHAEMPSFYRRGNVALCASLYEGASNSVMEAMAMGLALCSTRAGNVVELYHSQLLHFGETGIVLCDRTPQSFAAALGRLRADPARVRAMGQINREEIETRWSWRAWAQRYREFVERVT